MDYLDCELSLQAAGEARLMLPDRDFHGRPRLGEETLVELRALEHDAQAYGVCLFEHLLPAAGRLRVGYTEARTLARKQKMGLRFRLHFPPDLPVELTQLRWERLYDSVRKSPLGRDTATAFSRSYGVYGEVGTPTIEVPRLLVAHAAPDDSQDYGLARLDRDGMQEELDRGLEGQEELIRWEFLPPPVTAVRLRARLQEGRFHALHLVGHGLPSSRGGAQLLLEDDSGASRFLDEEQVQEVLLGNRDLRLVTLLSCYGAESGDRHALSGLAPRLVERGIPAVISMRKELRLSTAAEFTRHLYLNLARHGVVDAAVNEARQRLVFDDTDEWSDPVLFMRLRDGLLWEAPQEIEEEPQEVKPAEGNEKPLPGAPPLYIQNVGQLIQPGRDAHLGDSHFGTNAGRRAERADPSKRGGGDE